jgi:GH15 family glucan-1,4-alpha-glucosidase
MDSYSSQLTPYSTLHHANSANYAGGHFSISLAQGIDFNTKQQYLPSSNILQTRYIHEDGVVDLVDFFPRPKHDHVVTSTKSATPFRETTTVQGELKKWLVRRVECIRGRVNLGETDSAPFRIDHAHSCSRCRDLSRFQLRTR